MDNKVMKLIIFLYLGILIDCVEFHSYEIQKNTTVDLAPAKTFNALDTIICLKECNLIENCSAVSVYSKTSSNYNCSIFITKLSLNDSLQLENSILYSKKIKNNSILATIEYTTISATISTSPTSTSTTVTTTSTSTTSTSTTVTTTSTSPTSTSTYKYNVSYTNRDLKLFFTNFGNQGTVKSTGYNFSCLTSIGFMSDSDPTYYLTEECRNQVRIHDKNWTLIKSIEFLKPRYIIVVGNEIVFLTTQNSVFRTNKYLNISSNFKNSTAEFRGLSYNSKDGFLYVASENHNCLMKFTLDLNLIKTITLYGPPYAMAEYMGKLFISIVYTNQDNLPVILYEDETVTMYQQGTDCMNDSKKKVVSILIDISGNIAHLCNENDKTDGVGNVYVYGQSYNLIIGGKSIKGDKYIAEDANGKLISIWGSELNFFN